MIWILKLAIFLAIAVAKISADTNEEEQMRLGKG